MAQDDPDYIDPAVLRARVAADESAAMTGSRPRIRRISDEPQSSTGRASGFSLRGRGATFDNVRVVGQRLARAEILKPTVLCTLTLGDIGPDHTS